MHLGGNACEIGRIFGETGLSSYAHDLVENGRLDAAVNNSVQPAMVTSGQMFGLDRAIGILGEKEAETSFVLLAAAETSTDSLAVDLKWL